jgi:hypothetical protein
LFFRHQSRSSAHPALQCSEHQAVKRGNLLSRTLHGSRLQKSICSAQPKNQVPNFHSLCRNASFSTDWS